MEAKIEGLEDLKSVADMLSGALPALNRFVKINAQLVPEEHRHLLEGLETKSLAELEALNSEIEKLSAKEGSNKI